MIRSSACQRQADTFPALSGRHGERRSYTTSRDTISGSLTTSSAMPCSAAAEIGFGLCSPGQRRRVRRYLQSSLVCLGHTPDLGAIVGIGGRDVKRQQMAWDIDRQMQLRTLLAFGSVIGRSRPAFGRLSIMAARSAARPESTASRKIVRKSCASAVKHLALSQHWSC